jgi:predicted RNA-binding protein YlqC (UPF0109 family)
MFEQPDFGTPEVEDIDDELDDGLDDDDPEGDDLEDDEVDDELEDDTEASSPVAAVVAEDDEDDEDAEDDEDEDSANRADPPDGGAARAVLDFVTESLVDEPAAVVVETSEGRSGTRFSVRVAPGDMGRVIGRKGRTVQALRTLVRAAAASEGRDASVEVVD